MSIFGIIRENREALQELLRKNEQQANKTVSLFVLALIAGSLIPILSAQLSYGTMSYSVSSLTTYFTNAIGAIIVVCAWRQKFDAPWIKHGLVGFLVVALMIILAISPEYSLYVLAIPLFISVRYFDDRFSIRVGVSTLILLVVVTILNLWLHAVSPEVAAYHVWMETGWWENPSETIVGWFLSPAITFIFLIWYAVSIAKSSASIIKNFSEKNSAINAVETELGMASQIQMSSLPEPLYEIPGGNFSLAAREITAREVGGDFYDYYMLDDNRLAVLIADVSDKGIPAALFMMSAKKTLRCAIECSETLEEALTLTTRLMSEDNQSEMFFTLWLAVLDVRTGRGRYANAGHPLPFVKHKDGTIDTIDNSPDLFIGNFPYMAPCVHTFQMVAGDTLLLFTDGVTDAESVSATRFGEDGIENTMKATGPGAATIVDAIMADAQHFAEGMAQFDDMTILALECHELEESKSIALCLPAEEQSIEDSIDATEQLLALFDCPDTARRKINTIIDEILVNIVSYAYEDMEDSQVEIEEGKLGYGRMMYSVEAGDNYALLTFEDCGAAFDPLAKEDPDLDDTARIGGLGIYLCKNLSDNIRYERVDGKNVLEVYILWGI